MEEQNGSYVYDLGPDRSIKFFENYENTRCTKLQASNGSSFLITDSIFRSEGLAKRDFLEGACNDVERLDDLLQICDLSYSELYDAYKDYSRYLARNANKQLV